MHMLKFPAIPLLFAAAVLHAQSSGTQVHDSSALHPPPGAKVAIVEFVDLECPVCASTTPVVEAASAKYQIPVVRHDFLIPAHAWSPIAATNALWFDQKSRALGDQYRDAVFSAQPNLYNNPALLNDFTQKFAAAHNIALPFAIDPQGKLLAQVKADSELGTRTGIEHTPTVFVVSTSKTRPYVEVLNPAQELYTDLDQALTDTGSAAHAGSTPAPTGSAPSPEPAAQPGESTSAPITAPTQPIASQPATTPAASPTDAQPAPSPFNYKLILGIAAVILGIVIFVLAGRRKSA